MSTYLALEKSPDTHAAIWDIPVQIIHGSYDSVVPVSLGQKAKSQLQLLGYNPRYTEYEMDHEVCLQQIADISQLLQHWLR